MINFIIVVNMKENYKKMKKYILNIAILMLVANITFAQNSTDFTADDCDGVSHNLYSELDAGHVVVVCWVMPCTPCAQYAGFTQNAVQSFASSHPGIVKYYILDDLGGPSVTCGVLNGWNSQFQLNPDAVFTNNCVPAQIPNKPVIDMDDYGGSGMPKVVVIGPDHQVYYNQKNNLIKENDVIAGINLALSSSVSFNEESINDVSFTIDRNSNFLEINYSLNSPVYFEIFNYFGELVKKVRSNNLSVTKIDVNNLSNGMYIVQMISSNKRSSYKFIR